MAEAVFAWYGGLPASHSFGNNSLRFSGLYLLHATMCYYGAFAGYAQSATPRFTEVAKVKRPIPRQPFYLSLYILAPIFGLLQFATFGLEFHQLVRQSMRLHMYAMFRYLFFSLLMLVVVISLLSCIATYMSLCNQDYRWWWRSFVIGASSSIYIGLYGVLYLAALFRPDDWTSDIAFFIYFYIFLGCYICATGYLGVWSSYKFVSTIYKD